MFDKITVALDGSSASEIVLPYVRAIGNGIQTGYNAGNCIRG